MHPVQQAMVDNHASQCGFCTPGFVMSLFALYPKQSDFSGKCGRHTGRYPALHGYRPIIDADSDVGYAAPTRWNRGEARSQERLTRLCPFNARALQFPTFCAPQTIDELIAALEAAPHSLILSAAPGPSATFRRFTADRIHRRDSGAVPDSPKRVGVWIGSRCADRCLVRVGKPFPELAEQAVRICLSAHPASDVVRNMPTARPSTRRRWIAGAAVVGAKAQSRRVPLEKFF